MNDKSALSLNAAYLEENYEAWLKDPSSVPADLASFYAGFEFGQSQGGGLARKHLQSAVDSLVFHYRSVGHRSAEINPLNISRPPNPELELASYGLSEENLPETFGSNHLAGFPQGTLSEIIARVKAAYCGPIGAEYMHIQSTAERRFLQELIEPELNRPNLTESQRRTILRDLIHAEDFEHFLHSNYRGHKRFSLEGAETTVPAIRHLIHLCPGAGIVEIVMGMAHRGRLNVLANIIQKSLSDIFGEFEDNFQCESYCGDGDVKYHKGYSNDVVAADGKVIHISLTPNPSHLEMVGPVVEGKTRAKQADRHDTERATVLPLILHGDAAFAGQGMVAETFNLSQLKGYRTGGTIHFIVNNQVGFTTSPTDYQSGMYCTDMAKMADVPIFHVNGDRPEHVVRVMEIALHYRQRFKKDVVVDMWCYRRHGHNETDEPAFTQPLLYTQIARHPSVTALYERELLERRVVTPDDVTALKGEFDAELVSARDNSHEIRAPRDLTEMNGRWAGLQRDFTHEPVDTAVPAETLKSIARRLVEGIPAGFEVHRKILKLMQEFAATAEADGALNWANAETLAFGSLLLDGFGVRLSGEDSRRGTFSQRHAALYDQRTGEIYIPLTNLRPDQPQFCVYDSSLAEASVLAFDYGYSLADPNRLIMWEAQFGDFANGAQGVIDQFIAGGLSKWNRHSGLVMLLPHGYEGQGPEHSNAWLRRYLTLCAEDNMQVVQPSTPAQFFHVLRRQMLRNFRRPLVVLTPKSMLRLPEAASPLRDLATGGFREILDDPRDIPDPRRVIFCSGKVYHEIAAAMEKKGIDDIAVVRVEQFYPINDAAWDEVRLKYGDAPEWVWVSEEPTNFGAWGFVRATMSTEYHNNIWFVGRARSASPATGSLAVHKRQQQHILSHALQAEPLEPELNDGVAVFTQGEDLWHLKSRSLHSASPLAKAP